MCLTTFLRNKFLSLWRIQTQITLLYMIESIVILALFCAVLIVQIEQSKQILMSALQNRTMKQTISSTNTVMNRYYQLSEMMLNRGIYHLLSLNSLFQFSQNLQYQLIQQPSSCLLGNNDSMIFNNSFCYGIFGIDETDSYLLNYTALLTQSLFMMDGNDGTFASYLTPIDESQYFTMQPGFSFTKTFIPHNRPWYLNHMHMIQIGNYAPTYYSKPYVFYDSNEFSMTQTTNLTFINNSMAGVLATNIDQGVFKFMLQAMIPQTLSIIDDSGEIVVSQRDFSSLTYLFNESVTGFNYLDYLQILNETVNESSTDNCDQFNEDNILCRYNSFFDQQQFIFAKPLGTANMTLVITIDAMNDFAAINLAYENFSVKFDRQLGLMLEILIITMIITIVSNIFMIKYILKPLVNIHKYTKQEFLFSKKQAMKQLKKRKENNNCLKEITLAFQHLMIQKSNPIRIKQQRTEIESLKHPIMRKAPHNYKSFIQITKQSIKQQNLVPDLIDDEEYYFTSSFSLGSRYPRISNKSLQ